MVTYVNKNIKGFYITFDNKLDKKLYNNLGTTYEQYLNGWWIELSENQLQFHYDNPNASVEEVIKMQLANDYNADPLIVAKNEKLSEINEYDQSYKVNGFIVNDMITTWISVQERLNYKQSVEAAKLLQEDTLDFFIEGIPFSVSIQNAEYMLAMIQRYADKCFIVTTQHKANVNSFSNIEDVESYDYTVGYPETLKFNLV